MTRDMPPRDGPPDDPLSMDAAAMRRLGHRVIDRLVDRLAGLDAEPAWRWRARAELEARLADAAEAPAEPGLLLDLLDAEVLPFASRVDHPRFFGYVPGSSTWPSILGDLLAAGFNVFAGTSQAASGPNVLELRVLRWFSDWIGFPADAEGVLTSGGSAANLDALACAREAWRRRRGDAGARGAVYLSEQTHSSVLRALRIADVPADLVRTLPSDEEYRLPAAAVRAAMEADAAAGIPPFLVVANAGATSTGSVDPLSELADLCAGSGAWLHVDAAYGGFAVLSERGRAALAGIERADSVVLDPHKWLHQPFEVGCLLVRDGRLLADAFHVMPDYLQDTAVAGAEVNFADRGLQLTRSARGIKVWLSLRTFGVPAFAAAVDRALDLAELAARLVDEAPELEPLFGPRLGVVCFRRRPPGVESETAIEAVNADLVRRLMASGLGLVSSTRLRGRYALRVCVLSHRSTAEDVERVVHFLATSPVTPPGNASGASG